MSRQRSGRKMKGTDMSSPPWMTTYSDMVTLLLCFFVLLFSFASIDVDRFREILRSIQLSLGYQSIISSPVSPPPTLEEELPKGEDQEEEELREKLAEAKELESKVITFLEEAGLEEQVSTRREEWSVIMELPDQVFFDRGKADLKAEAIAILDKLAGFFRDLPYTVIVEGHTCNLPISTREFPSNWELSVVRAVRVTRYLVEERGLDAKRFIATGYGEFRPIASNDTAEGRARNRRVSFVITVVD